MTEDLERRLEERYDAIQTAFDFLYDRGVSLDELIDAALKCKQVKYNSTEYKRRMAQRREAAKAIDPATAFVWTRHVDLADPYDDGFQYGCIGRVTFVRAPGSSVHVEARDLPEETRQALSMLSELGLLD
jgi:hypothetical protein